MIENGAIPRTDPASSSLRLLRAWALLLPALWIGFVEIPATAQEILELDDTCIVSAFNRTAAVEPDGTWVLPNVPASLGRVRVRATCVRDGRTTSGQSELVTIPVNGVIHIEDFSVEAPTAIPESLQVTAPVTTLGSLGEVTQLTVTGIYSDGSTGDLSAESTGTAYSVSNSSVLQIDAGGGVTAVGPGVALVSALNQGALGVIRLAVVTSGDSDGDGLPDDFEIANGLDPNNPADAFGDLDEDGLTNLEEFQLGTDLRDPDSDGDGLEDGREVDETGTHPALFDTDGDGFSDGLEIQLGTDPLDPASFDLAAALAGLELTPASFALTFNTVVGEAASQLSAIGTLIDGTQLDVTALGLNYRSSDLTVCSFGSEPGRVFAGMDGTCIITAESGAFSAQSVGSVSTFQPTPLGFVTLPGFANNVDVVGDVAYVAAGAAGLVTVDVSDRSSPQILATFDTPGNALDVRVAASVAYVADGSAGLRILDVSNPAAPTFLGSLDTAGSARDIEVRGTRLYLADGTQGFRIIDVGDPASPFQIGSLGALGALGTIQGVGIDESSSLAALAAGGRGVHVIDIADPAAPRRLSTADPGGDARAVVLEGGFAHVADLSRSLTAVDLTDPFAPRVTARTPTATGGLLNDVVRVGDLVLGSDIFFVNGVPIVDVSVPEAPVPRAILDFGSFRDDNGTGIAADGQFLYLTAQRGDTRLYIGRYRQIEDDGAIAPQVSFRSPADGVNRIAGSRLTLEVDAADDVAVARVDFLIDGALVGSDTSRPYQLPFVVPTDGRTEVTLGARAVDFGNSVGTAEPISITVSPDGEGPSIGATQPAAGSRFTSGDALTVSAEVTDNVAVVAVTIEVGARAFTFASPPYEQQLSAPPVATTETVPVVVTARDPSGNETTESFDLIVDPVVDLEPPMPRFLTVGDGDPVLPGQELVVGFRITDNFLIDSYSLTIEGEPVDERFFIEQSTFEDQVTLTVPADALPGDTFVIRLETSDFGGNPANAELSLFVPGGSVLDGPLTLDSSFNGQDLILGSGTFTVVEPLDLSTLTMLSGAVIRGRVDEVLSIRTAGRLQIAGGALIDADGLGFAGGVPGSSSGGVPAGIVGSTRDAGGSHGGSGTRFNTGTPGEVYDSVYYPRFGGGGGAQDDDGVGDGRRGGGVVELEAETLVLNGTVRARGSGNTTGNGGRAGGAGGTVVMNAVTFSGIGVVQASGGSARPCCTSNRVGSGGGGRVAIHTQTLDLFDPVEQIEVFGGTRYETNGAVLSHGAPGTVLVSTAQSPLGELYVDSRELDGSDRRGVPTLLPGLGEDLVTLVEAQGADAWITGPEAFKHRWLGAFMTLRDGGGAELGTFRVIEVDGTGRALLAGAGGATAAADYGGSYRFDRLELRNGAGIDALDPVFSGRVEVVSGGARLPPALAADTVTVKAGVTVTPARGGELYLEVSGTMTVEAGALVNVSDRGFAGGRPGSTSGAAPAGIVGSTRDAGGSHGGRGTRFNAGTPGEVYGSVYVPRLSGGGGAQDDDGVGDGYPGGGVIEIVAQSFTLDGELRARGQGNTSGNGGRAGGAGGSILVDVGTLSGDGLIDASGGDARPCCTSNRVGSGGGGRVALYTDRIVGFDVVQQARAFGGIRFETNGSVLEYAAPGTVFYSDENSTHGHLIIDAGERNGSDRRGQITRLPTLGSGVVSSTEVAGGDLWVEAVDAFLPRWLGAFMTLFDGAAASLGSFEVIDLDPAGRVLLGSAAGAAGTAAGFEGSYRFDSIEVRNGAGLVMEDEPQIGDFRVFDGGARMPKAFQATNLTLLEGATVTLSEGGFMRASISGVLTIETGARLDVSGRGFAGGTSSSPNGGAPVWVTASTQDAGGSHGGSGTRFNAGSPGDVYNSVYVPQLTGAGGARDDDGVGDGYPGGGLLELSAAEVILDGEILARGSGNTTGNGGRAGGAGGSVLIRTGSLSGTGSIDASGGDARPCCTSNRVGSGGGGRVALYADQLSGFDPGSQVKVWGGARFQTNGAVLEYAAPGTLFIRMGTSLYGDLIIDAGETGGADRSGPSTRLPALGSGSITQLEADGADAWLTAPEVFRPRWDGAYMRLADGVGTELGLFEVLELDAMGRARLEGAASVIGATTWHGEYRFDAVEVRNGAGIETDDGIGGMDLEIGPGNAELPSAFMFDNLTLRSGAVVVPAEGGRFVGKVMGTLTLESGAILSVGGRGFQGGRPGSPNGGAPSWVTPSSRDAGGSHGGRGTRFNAGSPGDVYDSVYVPQLSGGGGAQDDDGVGNGFTGGGVIELDVGIFVLDGELRAHGGGTSSAGSGLGAAGAGGSVLITASSLSGTGVIDVRGGDVRPCCTSDRVGSGGGGRVALYVDQLNLDPVAQVIAQGGIRYQTNGEILEYGAPGTIYTSSASSTFGDLYVDSREVGGADRRGVPTALPSLGACAVSAVDAVGADAWITADITFRQRWLGAYATLQASNGADLGTFRALDIDGNRLLLEGAAGAAGATGCVGTYRFDSVELHNGAGLDATDPIEAGDLTVVAGSVRLPPEYRATRVQVLSGVVTPSRGGLLRAAVSGAFEVAAGARVDVSGRGFAGGTSGSPNGGSPAGVVASTQDAGGSHGGSGTRFNNGSSGETYDSVYLPVFSGAGGARDDDGVGDGYAGGGVIEISAASIHLEGELRARGGGNTSGNGGRPAGAGGTVFLQTGALSGAGLIDAGGGDARPCCTSNRVGSGGGGRVAIYADVLSGFDPGTQVTTTGGRRYETNGVILQYAGPGTVFVKTPAAAFGDLWVQQSRSNTSSVAQTPLPAIGGGTVGAVAASTDDPSDLWITPADPGATFALGVVGLSVRIDGIDYPVVEQTADRRSLLLQGAAGIVDVSDTYQGVYLFETVTVQGGATVIFNDLAAVTTFVVDGASSVVENVP